MSMETALPDDIVLCSLNELRDLCLSYPETANINSPCSQILQMGVAENCINI